MNNDLKKFRTMEGPARREAVRAHLIKHDGINFNKGPFELSHSERSALHDMAKAVSWRKSPASSFSLGAAFFVYLAKDVAKTAHVAAMVDKPAPRRALVYGRMVQA